MNYVGWGILALGICYMASIIVRDFNCLEGHSEQRLVKGVMMNHFVCDKFK